LKYVEIPWEKYNFFSANSDPPRGPPHPTPGPWAWATPSVVVAPVRLAVYHDWGWFFMAAYHM